tara:strand:- start:649 stop:921 length:273 start_codon:yes stop_codon:yes gene_type:complete
VHKKKKIYTLLLLTVLKLNKNNIKMKKADNGREGACVLFITFISNLNPPEISKFIKIGDIIIKNNKYILNNLVLVVCGVDLYASVLSMGK